VFLPSCLRPDRVNVFAASSRFVSLAVVESRKALLSDPASKLSDCKKKERKLVQELKRPGSVFR
jgi:hypothetical protein